MAPLRTLPSPWIAASLRSSRRRLASDGKAIVFLPIEGEEPALGLDPRVAGQRPVG